jgi:hypothetical protein
MFSDLEWDMQSGGEWLNAVSVHGLTRVLGVVVGMCQCRKNVNESSWRNAIDVIDSEENVFLGA